jgi:hypothetical protein
MEDDVKFSKEEYELARDSVRPKVGRGPWRGVWPTLEIQQARELVEKHGLETMWMHHRKMFMMYADRGARPEILTVMNRQLRSLAMLVFLYYTDREDGNGLQG